MGRKAVALQLDVGKVGTFDRFAGTPRAARDDIWQCETSDALVNNAGHGDYALISDTTEEQFDRLGDVHFKGVFFVMQKLLPLLAEGGRIVNLSSGLTRVSAPGWTAFSAVKSAIEVICYVAKERASRGIAVNTVAPGAIGTDFSAVSSATRLTSTTSFRP